MENTVKKSDVLVIRLSKADKLRLKLQAELDNLSLSEYIREQVQVIINK